jgi:hypothetical protein
VVVVVLVDVAEVVVAVDVLVVVGAVVVVVLVVVVLVVVVLVVVVLVVVVVVVGKLSAHLASRRWANFEAHIGAEDAPGLRHMAATR